MIKINLLPKKAQKQVVKYDFVLLVLVLAVSAAVAGGLFFKNLKDIADLKDEIAKTKQSVDRLQGSYKEYLSLEKQKKEVAARIAVVDRIKQGRALASRILNDLPLLVKENIWLKRFKKDEGRFELEGRSLDNDSVSDFVESYSKVPYAKTVDLRSVEDVTEGGSIVKKFIVNGNID